MRCAFAPGLALLGMIATASAAAQDAPTCPASSDTPRTAEQVIAAVVAHRCPPGSRIDVAMTIAGQAILLQQSGLCVADTVLTRTRRPTPETRVLALTCLLAPR
jgi:hypothetical protein